MTSRRLLLLGVAAIVAIATAMILSHQRTASVTAAGDTLYPALKDELNAVTAVRIYQSGDTRAVELLRKDGQWTVTDRSGYAADGVKVRKLLLALAEAKPVEEKTSNPENYPALGVEDTSAATASGARIELEGVSKPVNLIVGKAAGMKGTYVRRAGEPASWLVNESINASATTHDWLQTSIIDVTADRVQSVNVTVDNKSYTASKAARADADFRIDAMPKGKEADTFSVNNLASALSSLTLADVLPAQDFGAEKPSAHATVKTFDGLVADLDGYRKNDKHYVTVTAAYDAALAQRFHVETKTPANADAKADEAAAPKADADTVEQTAKATNDRLKGWVFEIAGYKYDAIFKPIAELTQK